MDTITEAIADLRERGYVHDFRTQDGAIVCDACEVAADPASAVAEEVRRFEGASDPGDESIVVAVSNGPCGHRGVLVMAFGPDSGPDEATVLRQLRSSEESPS